MRHEPIEYIIRDVEFRGLSLEQERPVWIPGPETRDLVDTVLEFCPKDKDKVHILEVGCGSGAVSLSLLDERDNIKILAIDDSWRALDLARKNFRHIFGKEGEKEGKIKFKRFPYHDFTKKNVKKFDIIISDPPNLRTSEWEKLTKEKKYYEARQALDGGKYGLDVVWELIRDSADNLKHDGLLIISVTNEQADYLTQYFKDNNGVAHDLKILTTRENEQLKSTYMIFQRVCNETEKIEPSKIEIIQEGGI